MSACMQRYLNDENNSFSFFFLYFVYYYFFFFFPRIDTLIFHSTRCSVNIAIVVLPGVKNRRENKFFLCHCFSLSIRVFFLLCPNSDPACTTPKDLFFCLSASLSLSLSPGSIGTLITTTTNIFFQPRQCVTITYL